MRRSRLTIVRAVRHQVKGYALRPLPSGFLFVACANANVAARLAHLPARLLRDFRANDVEPWGRKLARRAFATNRTARCGGQCASHDHRSLAPTGLADLLAPEVQGGPAPASARATPPDSQDGHRESAVGRGEDCQRATGQARTPGLAENGRQVPAEATAGATAWRSALVHLPEEPRKGDSRMRLLRGGHGDVPHSPRVCCHRARHTSASPRQRDSEPERGLDAAAVAGGRWGGR